MKRCILMVHSMNNKPKTLIIVEGGRLEPMFFEQLKNIFDLNLDIYCLKCNIYLLYKKMKEMGFNGNIKDVLLEVHDTEENRKLLSQNFAYTYLIFDFDVHHTEEYQKDIPLETIVKNNIVKVQEMAHYFVDETDPTIGKLYINYPMMESFKDCDSFEDDVYLTRSIILEDVKRYKNIVGCRKMANKRIDKYSKNDFIQLMRQNVRKLGRICQINDDLPKYSAYLNESNQFNILQHEVEFVSLQKVISVLNTSVFFVLDYYGNKNGFYDDVMTNR